MADPIGRNLLKSKGNIPSADEKLFKQYVEAVINQWDLHKPVDIMVAHRMVSTWMKMRFIESSMESTGMFFEDRDDAGKVTRVRMNELAYYLKQLEGDFRSYYRVLQGYGKKDVAVVQDFSTWLETDGKTKSKKSKD